MLPEITIFGTTVRTMWIVGVIITALMFLLTYIKAKNIKNSEYNEIRYILPKLTFSVFGMFFGAVIYDAVFKYIQTGIFYPQGMAFYGGLIGGALALYAVMRFSPRASSLSPSMWLDKLTIPFALCHSLGRIGCFLAGCCYGLETDSVFGVVFPDQTEYGIIHNGACLPTQLFEAFFVLIIVLILRFLFKKNTFTAYIFIYSVYRFFAEFMRGDNRGSEICGLSPAQITAVIIIVAVSVTNIKRIIKSKNKIGKE